MERKEFALFASALRTYYSRENLLPNEEAMELWYRQLEDIPYKVAEIILQKWVATNKWSPSISEIREQALALKQVKIPDWSDGWEQVMKAISRYGMYRVPEALDSLDGITRICVERLGFRNLCLSENISVERASFRKIYEQLSEREKQQAQLPPAIAKLIDEMKTGNLIDGKKVAELGE